MASMTRAAVPGMNITSNIKLQKVGAAMLFSPVWQCNNPPTIRNQKQKLIKLAIYKRHYKLWWVKTSSSLFMVSIKLDSTSFGALCSVLMEFFFINDSIRKHVVVYIKDFNDYILVYGGTSLRINLWWKRKMMNQKSQSPVCSMSVAWFAWT